MGWLQYAFLALWICQVATSSYDDDFHHRDKRQIYPLYLHKSNIVKLRYNSSARTSQIMASMDQVKTFLETRTCIRLQYVDYAADDVIPIHYVFNSSCHTSLFLKNFLFGEKLPRVEYDDVIPIHYAVDSPCRVSYSTDPRTRLTTKELKLHNGCAFDLAVHEFLHLLGFDHTQCRPDRDNYLDIKVTRGKLSSNWDPWHTITTDEPWDYGSVMAYPLINKCDAELCVSMMTKDKRYFRTMIGTEFVQFSDVLAVNNQFCKDRCPQQHNCQNGGYPNPNDCNVCNCVHGFDGRTCTEKPDTCGFTVDASSTWQNVSVLVAGRRGEKDHEETCYHWIVAPEGKWVEYEIFLDYRFSGGPSFFLGIFGNDDVRMSPYFFDPLTTAEVVAAGKKGVYKGRVLRLQTKPWLNYSIGLLHQVAYRFVESDGSGPVTTKSTTTSTTTRSTTTTTTTRTTTTPKTTTTTTTRSTTTSTTTTTTRSTTTSRTTTTSTTTRTTTATTPSTNTRTPDAQGNVNANVLQVTCVSKGSPAPKSLFEQNVVRGQLRYLLKTDPPKFMIVMVTSPGQGECLGKDMYQYELVFDSAPDSGVNVVLMNLYAEGSPYVKSMPPVWDTYSPLAQMLVRAFTQGNQFQPKRDLRIEASGTHSFELIRKYHNSKFLQILVDEAK